MKIGIDARWIFKELSGIGSYTREIIRHLARLEREHTFVVYFNDPVLRDRTVAEVDLARAPNFSTHLLPFGLFSISNQLRLPGLLAEDALDVFHSPNYMIPLRAFPRGRPGRIRCVTTIHDLIPLMFPAYAPRAWKRRFFLLYRWLMHEVAVRSDLVLTDSRSSRDDVVRYLHLPPERVLAIPLGVLPKFQPAARTDADAAHVAKVKARLVVLCDQRRDLAASLGQLLADIFAGRNRLKVYRQFKMYNDPTLNPYIYAAKKSAA